MAAETSRASQSDQLTYSKDAWSRSSSSQPSMMQPNGTNSGISAGLRAEMNSTSAPSGDDSSKPPMEDAINTAFDKSEAASHVDPNLVAQITEQVLSNLKASGITGAPAATSQPTATQSAPPPLHQPAPSHPQNWTEPSPTSPASSSVPPRYTPPSPNRHDVSSLGSSSPEPQFSDSASYSSRDTNRTRRRDSQISSSGLDDTSSAKSRPRPVRVPSAVPETTLEKIWQPLFDKGRPTPRLGQFLRGIAKHIIDDCKPKNSIVVTPGKMADFLEITKVPDELYPWNAVFGGRLTNAAISRLYRDLRCQHHLVQFEGQYQDVPSIPGLTQSGFETFMTTLILAHPDHEYERLAKAVLDMPISNAEDSRERFPKEISRRLFPQVGDSHLQQRLVAAVSVDPAIQLRNSSPMPPPPPTQPPSSTSFSERERNPYSKSSFSSAVDDDDLRSTPIPIERERKPYTAREGSGKVYEDNRTNFAQARQDASIRQTRANTAIPVQQPFAQPREIPSTANRAHRMSMTGGPMRFGSSPVIQNPYTRSEGTNVGDVPPMYYASNLHGDNPARKLSGDEYSKGYSPSPYTQGSYDPRRGPGGSDGYGSFPNSGGYAQPPSRY